MAASTGNMPDADALLMLKHDIKNQLSNIQLAIEGLRYEVEDLDGDTGFYIQSMLSSAQKIDKLLDIIKTDI
jgi:nitrogen-specific signal transduction histidine kinase